jgi:hypothetical protein
MMLPASPLLAPVAMSRPYDEEPRLEPTGQVLGADARRSRLPWSGRFGRWAHPAGAGRVGATSCGALFPAVPLRVHAPSAASVASERAATAGEP